MAGAITRGKLIRADLANWDGKTSTHSRIDATGGTVTGLAVGNEVDVLQVFGSGTDRTRASIRSATNHINTTACTLVFAPGTWTIDDDLTIQSNLLAKIPAGCVFSVSSGKTLTFSGPVYAESSTFYSGAGTTVLSVDSIVGGKPWIARTAAEIAAGVTPVNYAILSHALIGYAIPERYGNNTTPGTTNMTTAVQAALSLGVSVKLIDDYVVSALTLSASDVTVDGPGRLIKIADVDGRVLYITGSRNKIIGVRFDGTAAAPTPGSLNDMVRVQGGNDNTIENCYINGSRGGGIRVDGGARNKVIGNTVLNVYHNSVLICNDGADNNNVIGNYLSGTTAQNNIYLTASDGGTANGDFIYNNIVCGNVCNGAFDTGIETGYHAYYTIIDANRVTGGNNPPILIRDGLGIVVSNNVTQNSGALVDGISIVPHHETSLWNYATKITGNIVLGAHSRAGIYIGGSGVTVEGNTLYDNETSVTSAGVGLAGYGITLASSITDIVVRGNYVRQFERGIDLNQDASAVTRTRVQIVDNIIYETSTAINCFNCTFTDSVIRNNDITKTVLNGVLLTSVTGASTGELIYSPGMINLDGWSGATPVHLNAASGTVRTFAASDATPSVLNGSMFRTDSGALTITMFDDGYHGQEITIVSTGAVTFDTTGTNLAGSSVDIVTAAGDVTKWVMDFGTTWRLLGFVDVSVDNSAGA